MLLPHGHNLGSSYGEHLENTGGNLWFLFCHEQKGERPSECDAFQSTFHLAVAAQVLLPAGGE